MIDEPGADADRLIRELVSSGRTATDKEILQVLGQLASALFDPRTVHVRVAERGATYLGQTFGRDASSLDYHLIKRTAIERQWREGTTADACLGDLRRAMFVPSGRLVVYDRRGGAIAAVVAQTSEVVPPERLGERWLPLLVVFYAADPGVIVTGYQISSLESVAIPSEAVWLTRHGTD